MDGFVPRQDEYFKSLCLTLNLTRVSPKYFPKAVKISICRVNESNSRNHGEAQAARPHHQWMCLFYMKKRSDL